MTDYGSGGYGGTPEDPGPPTSEELIEAAAKAAHAVERRLLEQEEDAEENAHQREMCEQELNAAKARADQFAKDLLKETKAHQATRAELASCRKDLIAARTELARANDAHAELLRSYDAATAERDTAQAANEEAQELLAEAHRTIAVQAVELGDLEQQQADDRLTIADLEQRLADCQAGQVEP